MSSYADLATLKFHLSASSDGTASFTDADNILLQMCLDAATLQIEQFCKRKFAAETGATKVFLATSYDYLDLQPDIRTVTSVKVDYLGDLTFSRTLATTDYWKLPLQSYPDSGIYNSLVIAPRSSQAFTPGYQVQVVGDWGYVVGGQAPATIREACLLQAARLYVRRGSPLGILQSVDLGQFTRISKADPDVQALCAPYRASSATWAMV